MTHPLLFSLLCMAVPTPSKALPDVDLSPQAEQSTYFIARLIMRVVKWILDLVGLAEDHSLFVWIYAIVVFGIAIGVGMIVKWIILLLVRIVGRHLKSPLYRLLTEAHFFSKTCRIVPAIVFLIFIEFTISSYSHISVWISRFTWIYLLFVVSNSINIIVTVAWHHIDMRENKRRLPLNGVVQVIKGTVWILFAIVAIAVIVDKSPGSLLAGIGAFAAVLMLVFKDSILGVVAGVQLSENDSLHVGDWIKVAGTDANGVVTEVSLTSVKVLNWDKTTTTVPPYSLVSGSFTNYRSMQESNTRRIERSYMIDADSVVPTDDQMLSEFSNLPLMKEWIEAKIRQRNEGHTCDVNNPEGLVDGSIETNLGIFRAYVKMYLDNNKNIDKESTCFVSTLAQTSSGIPLQLYCFTTTSSWLPYEAVQSAIFEHIAVMLYRFRLYIFEAESGRDSILEGIVGTRTNGIFGLPYPFYTGSGSPENPGDPEITAKGTDATSAPSAKVSSTKVSDASESARQPDAK